MTPRKDRLKMLRSATIAAISLLATFVAACGGGGGSGDADPATAVPGNAGFYMEVAVRPEGDLREDALEAAGKLMRTPDPEARIRELVERGFAEGSDGEIDYDRDVRPWLGERAGLWAAAQQEFGGVALLAATDTDQAWESIQAAIRRSGEQSTARSYKDVDYLVDDEGTAVGIVGDFAAFGTEAEFKRTVDASEGSSLADNDRYRGAVDGLEEDRLAHFYSDLRAVFELARQDPESAEGLRQLEAFLPLDRIPPLTGAFLANGDRMAIDLGLDIEGNETLRSLGAFTGFSGTPLVQELPGDSWLTLGWPRLGESTRALLQQFGGAVGGAMLQEQLRGQLGLDLEQDVLSWIGDVAIFARGTTLESLDGGAVIEVTDEARAEAAFGKIVGVVRTRGGVDARPVQIDGAETAFAINDGSTPKPIVLARGEGKVVVGYGEAAAADALAGDDRFGDSDAYGQAKEALGDDVEPGILVSMPAVLELVQATGSSDADFEQVRPYLEALTVIAVGGRVDGDRAEGRIAAGLK
jgi:uncharacterized protein DUF3352